MNSKKFYSSWTVNLLQEKRLFLAKKKISIKIVSYVCCMQRMQHIFDKSLKKLWKINKLMFSTFIQLKMKHDYFKSYLHWLSENNLNKCYEICKMRQTLKHLLLNCKHYRAEQLQFKAKAQFKNMNIILMLFIIKIERIAMLKYLKSTWIMTRKWLLKTKK